MIADGTAWIWNRTREIFHTAKQVLDYYHSSEHLYELANPQYGKDTRKGRERVEATLTRLFHNQKTHVLAGIKRMIACSLEARKMIDL